MKPWTPFGDMVPQTLLQYQFLSLSESTVLAGWCFILIKWDPFLAPQYERFQWRDDVAFAKYLRNDWWQKVRVSHNFIKNQFNLPSIRSAMGQLITIPLKHEKAARKKLVWSVDSCQKVFCTESLTWMWRFVYIGWGLLMAESKWCWCGSGSSPYTGES